MTGQSKATRAAAPTKAAPAPAADEAEGLEDRVARLRQENELMTLEIENRTLRKRLGLPERKSF